jgi:hypothetical protein
MQIDITQVHGVGEWTQLLWVVLLVTDDPSHRAGWLRAGESPWTTWRRGARSLESKPVRQCETSSGVRHFTRLGEAVHRHNLTEDRRWREGEGAHDISIGQSAGRPAVEARLGPFRLEELNRIP